MTNSEARKRNQAAQTPQQPHQQPNAPGVDSGAIGRLTEDQRAQIDERIASGLWGYYLHFDPTGVPEIDRILSAIGLAAKAFHHTENWNDDLDWDYGPIPKGETCADFIQRAADDAAAIVREHVTAALADIEEVVYNSGPLDHSAGCDSHHGEYPCNCLLSRLYATLRAARQEQDR